jgi:hypothetical protein
MKLTTIFMMLSLSACAIVERHPRSGYDSAGEGGSETDHDIYRMKALVSENEAREELGLMGRPLSENERTLVETRIRLKRQERRLSSRREKKQYFDLRSALRSDRERLAFLSLPTYEARERWASARGLKTSEESDSDDMTKAIESNDIALGMSSKAVTESWGDPDAVEVAGDPVYGFERWKYNRYVSGDEGYQKELRIVYFEGGRVVGWSGPDAMAFQEFSEHRPN